MSLIDRENLLALYDVGEADGLDPKKLHVPLLVVRQNILDMPDVDARKNVRGRWKYSALDDTVTCSICAYDHYLGTYHEYEKNFCPNCGADMRG